MNRRTKLGIARDKKIKSLHGGKRVSADGNVYYEYRENRSDFNRTKKFSKGGDLWTPLDFESIEEYFDYINDSLINGNRTQVKELYNDMDESQKRQFFRYANMQEGMFDEVVEYINENVRKYAKGGGVSVLKDKIDHINKNYDGVVASKTYSDNRIQVVSPYFNTLNDIKRNEFDGSGLLERYGNTTQYVLYSNKTYAKGGVLDEKESMLHFVLNQLPSGTVANMSSYSDYKTIDKIKSQIINILQEEGDVKYSIYNLKSLIKRAEQEIEEPSDRSYMNTEVGKVDVYSGMSKFKKDAVVYHALSTEGGMNRSVFWIVNKSDADKLENIGYDITKVNVKKGEKPYALTTGEIGSKPDYYAKGGGLNDSHLDDLYNKSNKNVQGALELYAGELGIYNMFYGHKVDASKKAKYKKAQKYLESKYMAKGGGVGKRSLMSVAHLVDWKGEGIKKWYMRSYSKDDLGEEMNDEATFTDLWNGIHNKENVYNIMGVGDSVIRERLFEYLSLIYDVEYSYVYNKWLESADYANGGGVFSLKEKIKSDFPDMKDSDFDRHETDLYVRYTPELDSWLKDNYEHYSNITKFNSQIDKKRWFDIPFAEFHTKYAGKFENGGDVEDEEEFVVHGHYTVSNSGGYEIMLSDSGDAARVRDSFGSDNPETSDWLDIEYVTDEEGEPDEDGNLPSEPVIDPQGYNIPLNLVMRSNFKKGGSVKQKGAQYKIDGYGSGDRKRKAKPVGFRYERIRDPKTGRLRIVTKEDKKYYATPTQKEIKAYKDGDVTARKMLGFENRADHSDKEPVRFSRKFAKGGSVTIGEYKATFKVKYALDGGKLKDGYVVSVLTPSEHEVDYYNLYDSKKNLVKKLSPQEAQQLVKDKKITFVKRYDVPNEKQKSSPDTEVKDMSYAERREWIKENIVPNLKSAVNYWNSYNHGSFDSNDKKSEKEFLDKVRKSAMYGSTEEFEKATSLKVDDSGWGLQSPEGEEFEQVASDNTYNSSYLGLFDWNFRIYSIYDERFVLIAHPHMGGDVRGNYGDPIFLEGESKEDVLMKFYEEVIDGKHSVNLEFKDGTSVTFDAQQDSDVNYYELYDDGSKKKIKLGSPVEVLTTTFKTFGGWKGDDFVEEIVDEFERSKEKKAKKMSNGGGVDSSDNSNYAIIAYNKAKAGTTQNKGFYDAVSVAKTLNVGSDLGNNLIIVKGNLLWTNARVKGVELENGEKIYYGEYQHEYFTENQLDYLRSIMVEENGDNYNKFDFSKLNQMKNGGGIGHKFKVGDLVFNRTLGSRGLVGLVISEGKENEEYETFEYDVLYRGYGGDVIPTEESEIVDITEGYIDFAEGNGDLMHYPNIAKKHGITLNKKYQEAIDENSDEEEFARGGHVSKGELVWGKLSSSDKINFLHENFTPEITPRTQQTLVGKTFNFLPKNVKIKIESKYANVEDYAKGGGVNEPELLIDANRGIYVPQTFYERYDFKEFGLNKEDYTELSDPENEGYWDAWNDVVDTAETKDGKTLFEIEGNLFLADKYHDFDLLKKGGAIKQRGAQYERDIPYGGRDTSVRARPVGYRYRKIVDKKTGRLRTIEKTDKEYYKPVTQKDIQAYEEGDKSARRRIYKELRRDHSDKPSKNKRAY